MMEILERLKEQDDLKEVTIKIKTKDDMFYTWAKINADTLPVETDLDCGLNTSTRIYNEIYLSLSNLFEILKEKQPILMYCENKIIDYSQFKETVLYWETKMGSTEKK